MRWPNLPRWKTYLLTLSGSLLLIWTLATVQMLFVFKVLSPRLFIIPTIAGALFGFMLARIWLLKNQLELQTALFQGTAEVSQSFTWIHDYHDLVYASPQSRQVMGVYASGLEGNMNRMLSLLEKKDQAHMRKALSALLTAPGTDYLELRLSQGPQVGKQLGCRMNTLLGESGNILGVAGNILVLGQSQHEIRSLRKQINVDELTGLGKVKMLRADLEVICRDQHRPHALVSLYLAGARHLQQLYGEQIFDAFLLQLVTGLKDKLGGVSRLYRAEFNRLVLLLEDVREDQISACMQTVQKQVERPVEVYGMKLSVGMRAGVSLYPADAAHGNEWLECSELAMETARKSKESWCWYKPFMRQNKEQQRELEQALIQAVEQKNIEVRAQPVFRLSDMRVAGVEVCAFWRAEKGKWQPIHEVKQQMYHLGLAQQVLTEVLEQSLKFIEQMEKQGIHLQCGFNVDEAELMDAKLLARVQRSLQTHALAANRLVIEVDESTLLNSNEFVRHRVQALGEMGFVLAMDHFSMGLSSLQLLQRLPVQVVKIERQLLHSEPMEQRNVIAAVVEYGKALQVDMLLNQVDDKEALEQAKTIGAQFVQGPWLQDALGLKALKDWLQKYR